MRKATHEGQARCVSEKTGAGSVPSASRSCSMWKFGGVTGVRLVDQHDASASWMFDDRGLSWRPQASGC